MVFLIRQIPNPKIVTPLNQNYGLGVLDCVSNCILYVLFSFFSSNKQKAEHMDVDLNVNPYAK